MKNSRVIRIDAATGEARLIYDFVKEDYAWKRATELEVLEASRPVRQAWFSATNSDDWQALARAFFNYRKNLVLP